MSAAYPLIDFDPVAFSIGPLSVHWYGIMYLLAFMTFWGFGTLRARSRPWLGWKPEEVGDVLFYGMLGVILGGRIGYVLFYGFDTLLDNPLSIFRVWDGGMSFHGGLLGVILAMAWFARKTGRTFWQVSDFVAPLVPIGLALGRLGNFIGGELWGRVSDVPWAMIFPGSLGAGATAGLPLEEAWRSGMLDEFARHPSQLYQAGLEGVALFLLLQWFSARPRPQAMVSGLFLVGYSLFRIVTEFFREPDLHIGFLAGGWMTMGMLLSLPMLAAGLFIMYWSRKRAEAPSMGS